MAAAFTVNVRGDRRICDDDGCENPRSFEITGFTGGAEYQVEIRLNSANGWTGWVRAAEKARPRGDVMIRRMYSSTLFSHRWLLGRIDEFMTVLWGQ